MADANATLREIAGAGLFESALQARFDALLNERNWLVHRSRATSRSAIHSDSAAQELIARIDTVAELSRILLGEVGGLVSAFIRQHGIDQQHIDEETVAILRRWHDPDE